MIGNGDWKMNRDNPLNWRVLTYNIICVYLVPFSSPFGLGWPWEWLPWVDPRGWLQRGSRATHQGSRDGGLWLPHYQSTSWGYTLPGKTRLILSCDKFIAIEKISSRCILIHHSSISSLAVQFGNCEWIGFRYLIFEPNRTSCKEKFVKDGWGSLTFHNV